MCLSTPDLADMYTASDGLRLSYMRNVCCKINEIEPSITLRFLDDSDLTSVLIYENDDNAEADLVFIGCHLMFAGW